MTAQPISDPCSPPRPAAGHESDESLLVSVAADDERAFAEFVDRYRRRALAIASRTGADAEEAVQEANLSAWKARRTFDPGRGRAAAWYLSIVRNRAIDVYRHHATAQRMLTGPSALEHQVGNAPSPEDRAVERERETQMREAVAELPAAQRQVIQLGFYGGLSHSEMASRIAAPIGTIKGRSRLALTRLRRECAERVASPFADGAPASP